MHPKTFTSGFPFVFGCFQATSFNGQLECHLDPKIDKGWGERGTPWVEIAFRLILAMNMDALMLIIRIENCGHGSWYAYDSELASRIEFSLR